MSIKPVCVCGAQIYQKGNFFVDEYFVILIMVSSYVVFTYEIPLYISLIHCFKCFVFFSLDSIGIRH